MKNPIYKIKNLSYVKNNNSIINIKNFEIHRGACYMFNGGMASGKSLLIDIMNNKIKKFDGEVFYDNNNIKSLSKKQYNEDISVVSQNPKIPFFKNVKTYISDEILKKHNGATSEKQLNNIITVMDLKHLLNKKLRKLTPGQFRWIDLAAKIASYPKVLFIDEIELHLSKKNMEILSKILYRKCNYDGVTLIATTQNHDPFSNLISVNITINQGRITRVRSFSQKSKKYK